MKKIEQLVNDLVNGNLSDAQKSSKGFSYKVLHNAMREYLGYNYKISVLAVQYLKTGQGFQEYCNSI